MSTAYRFTYMRQRTAGRAARPARRAARPKPAARRPWVKLAAQRPARASARPALGLTGRLAVTSLLAVVSLAVVGQQSRLYDAAAERFHQLAALWPSAPAEHAPAPKRVPASAPEATAPFEPMALLADGGIFALAKDGRVAVHAPGQNTRGLMIVTGAQVTEAPEAGGVRLKTNADLGLLRRLLALPLAAEISEVHMGGEGRLVVYLRDATKILAEERPDLERAFERLARVRQDLQDKQLAPSVIDLRYANQIVVRTRR